MEFLRYFSKNLVILNKRAGVPKILHTKKEIDYI